MKTIIELYDKEPIRNVLATTILKPEHVIFIGSKDMDENKILNFFKHRRIHVNAEFVHVRTDNIENIYQKLEELIKKYPESYIHVTGGSNLELIAVGRISQLQPLPLFYYNDKKNCFINICNCPMEQLTHNEKFSVEDFFIMSGASLSGHGHLSIEELTDEIKKDINTIWNIFFHNTYNWRNFVNYMQFITSQADKKPTKSREPLSESIYTNKTYAKDMLKILNAEGMIRKYTAKGNKVSFLYKNQIVKKSINDVGSILELYLFMTAKNMNYFDDVKISVIVDWNGIEKEPNNVINEIDVVLTKGIHPIFISCKSGEPSTKDLTELNTLVKKFGGQYAKGVIATTSNFSGRANSVYKRACDLDLTVIEKADIEKNKLETILKNIVK